MTYAQITLKERYALALLRRQGKSLRAIARELRCAPSTISRELQRNRWRCDPRYYWYVCAQSYTNRRRRISRRNTQHGACVVTLVERKSGFTAIGLLPRRAAPEVNARLRQMIAAQPRPVRTMTFDNGTEFHSYKALEATIDAQCYFATPHHAWERGTNENTNGLIRQYFKKRTSMEHLTQPDCQRVADKLNRRPRKRLDFRTPEEVYVP